MWCIKGADAKRRRRTPSLIPWKPQRSEMILFKEL